MRTKAIFAVLLMGLLAFGAPKAAHAQFAVIDVASLAQLIQEYETLQQQLSTAENQLNQARSAYAAITGNRGMQLLLSGTQRNYLPTNWSQLSQVMSGRSGSYPALAGNVSSLVSTNAVLTPAQVAAMSPTQQAQLTAAREMSIAQRREMQVNFVGTSQVQIVRAALAEAGRDLASFPIAKRIYIAVDDDAGRARDRINHAMARIYGHRVPSIEAAAVAGTPADCIREASAVASAGAELILFTTVFDQPEQMERLAAEVMPHIHNPA